ncbi:MAG: hypothetical protein LBF22_07195 [Deltaproteobacteria bacterium]|nr:hypothetical protein [Deltaproteobacteria bacterium]
MLFTRSRLRIQVDLLLKNSVVVLALTMTMNLRYLRSTDRNSTFPSGILSHFGFRLALRT